jgi:hypothetical protein
MEIWKIIPGHNNYEASNTGKIKRSDNILTGYLHKSY